MDTQTNPKIRRTPAQAIDLRRDLIPLPMRVAALQKTRLDAARARTGIPVQEHVRRAIDLYLDVVEAEAKQRGQLDVVIPPAQVRQQAAAPVTSTRQAKTKAKPTIRRK
jgi:hypothetical protein